MVPVRQLNGPAGSVAVPAFSRLQSDPERFARYYLRLVNIVLWISTPIFGFLFSAARPVIRVVLGNQWVEAAPVFQVLAISALGQLLLDTTVWLLVSRGESGRLLKLLMIVSPVIVASFLIGLPFGIKGVALSGSLVMIGVFPWILRFSFRGTHLTLRRLGPAILWPISICLAGVGLAELALYVFTPPRAVPQLLVVGFSFAVIYFLAALIRPVREELRSFRKLLGHFGPFKSFA
jgi:PST family polysaccharide transporter